MTINHQTIASLAAAWGVDAIGREGPQHVTRRHGKWYIVRPGKWYIVRAGERAGATAAQSRALNRAEGYSVGYIHPIDAAAQECGRCRGPSK